MRYYPEHSLKPSDLIAPQQLTNFFAEGQVPAARTIMLLFEFLMAPNA